jgi:23S rRNA (pseudouridine1915-N3)-methyltransferase
MLHVKLICVGRLREPHYIAACREYEKRLTPLCRLETLEIPEEPERPGALEREGERLIAAIPAGAYTVALCIEGESVSSEALAARLESLTARGVSRMCLIIGGSNGLSDAVKARADWRLSMSAMTFPHHLARVMALEQLYRAMSINSGSKYHK